MGMYDQVKLKCPHCGEYNYLQSKASGCNLDTFDAERIPIEIIGDLMDYPESYNEVCEKCEGKFKFISNSPRFGNGTLIKKE